MLQLTYQIVVKAIGMCAAKFENSFINLRQEFSKVECSFHEQLACTSETKITLQKWLLHALDEQVVLSVCDSISIAIF